MTTPTTADVMRGIKILQENGLPEVAALLAKNEKAARDAAKAKRGRKMYVGDKPSKAGAFYLIEPHDDGAGDENTEE